MRLVSIASARPNFVKLAAVHHAIVESGANTEHMIVHTGQHYDPLLSDIFFRQLDIPQPVKNLGIHGGTREETIERTRLALLPVLRELRSDWVLVYGDVNGAVGAAQAAKELGLRVAHVEAGLRSGDPGMPEEHNRIAIDAIADLLLCSEQSGIDHLRSEKAGGRMELVGNTMIDTLLRMRPFIDRQEVRIRDADGEPIEQFAVLTLHRPSNVDDPQKLRSVFQFVGEVSEFTPLVIPKHPRLQKALAAQPEIEAGLRRRVSWGEPVGYLHFLALMSRSSFILTDSGGIQEEAVLLGKCCFTLRRNTERPATVLSGSNVLIDLDRPEDRAQVLAFARHPTDPAITVPAFWDGKAGERIRRLLAASS